MSSGKLLEVGRTTNLPFLRNDGPLVLRTKRAFFWSVNRNGATSDGATKVTGGLRRRRLASSHGSGKVTAPAAPSRSARDARIQPLMGIPKDHNLSSQPGNSATPYRKFEVEGPFVPDHEL